MIASLSTSNMASPRPRGSDREVEEPSSGFRWESQEESSVDSSWIPASAVEVIFFTSSFRMAYQREWALAPLDDRLGCEWVARVAGPASGAMKAEGDALGFEVAGETSLEDRPVAFASGFRCDVICLSARSQNSMSRPAGRPACSQRL